MPAPDAAPSAASIDESPPAPATKSTEHASAKPSPEATKASEAAKVPDAPRTIAKATPDATKPADATPAASSAADDPKALAALEGRGAAPTSADAAGRTYAVQIAAFSTADRARGLRDQLVANGLRSYTESVSTTQGLRTRVRLGPFASREAADHAKQKLKTMKLDGSVVPL